MPYILVSRKSKISIKPLSMDFPIYVDILADSGILADNQCKVFVATEASTRPPAETATWASVWGSAVAVNEMCSRQGRGGFTRPYSTYTYAFRRPGFSSNGRLPFFGSSRLILTRAEL